MLTYIWVNISTMPLPDPTLPWLLIDEFQSNFTVSAQTTVLCNMFEYYTLKLLPHLPGHNELIMTTMMLISVNMTACNAANEDKVVSTKHYDVMTWTHFLNYWPFVWGIHQLLVDSPHKGSVMQSFDYE